MATTTETLNHGFPATGPARQTQEKEQKFWLGHCQHGTIVRAKCADCRLAQVFWSQVTPKDGHLLWTGDASMGVGVLNMSAFHLPVKDVRYAHEVAWYMVTGNWETIRRTCGDRACVLFEHMAIGKQHDPSKIVMEQEINTTRVRDLLRLAFAMPTPWFHIVSYREPNEGALYEAWSDVSEQEARELRRAGKKPDVVQALDFPVSEGGAVFLSHEAVAEGESSRLDTNAIKRGLTVFHRDFFLDFEQWRKSKEDEHTANVFLNCCLFGRMIFER
jgi:hypothetical protein